MEETVRESPVDEREALVRAFADAPVPLAVVDGSLRVLDANEAFAAAAGRGDVPPGTLLATLFPPSSGALPATPSFVYATAGAAGALEVRVRQSGGTRVVALVPLAPGPAKVPARAEGEALLLLGRDVAAAQSEEALVSAIARTLRDLFPGRCYAIRIVDPKTFALTALYAEGRLVAGAREVLHVRRTAARRLGLSPGSLAGERVQLADADRPIFEGTRSVLAVPLVSSGQLFGLINVEHDGSIATDPEADDRTLIQLANTASVGIRNAKLIDELTFVKKYLEDLIENANALILVCNREGRMIVFNRALSELSGFPREEILGHDLFEFVPEGEKKRLQRVVAQSLRGQAVSNFETLLLDRSGEEKRVAFSTAAILAPGGEIEGVIAIGQDLTKFKDLERRMIQAEKLASLGQLAAGLVHEINNPLTAMVVAAESFGSKFALDPAAKSDRDKVQKIVQNGQRVLRFTRDLISYARPSSDQIEAVDLHEVLDQAISFCEHELRNSGATVHRRFADVPRIRARRNNLQQVFVNLITNACHALRPGGTITIGVRTCADGGGVELEVRDDGAGIEPRHLDRIFEPFFTTKPDGRGTGLGLSIVQGIIEKHGGMISVESAAGRGTSFRIRLPDGSD